MVVWFPDPAEDPTCERRWQEVTAAFPHVYPRYISKVPASVGGTWLGCAEQGCQEHGDADTSLTH